MQITNPILTQINNPRSNNSNSQNYSQQIQQIKNLMQEIKMSSNPQLIIKNLLNQNPSLQLLLKGGSLQQIAQQMAQQRGIDLNQLIQQLQS